MHGGNRGATRTRRTELRSCGSLASGVSLRPHFAGASIRLKPRLAHPAVSQHVPPHRGITAQWPERRFGLRQRGEIVVVQLVTPVRVIAILEMEPLGQCRGEGYLAAVFAHGAAQGTDGIVSLASRYVVPAFDGGRRELNVAFCHRMTPRLLCRRANGCLERSAQGESSRAVPRRRIETAPTGRRSDFWVFGSSRLLTKRVKGPR